MDVSYGTFGLGSANVLKNNSEQFESRYVNVKIMKTNSIMLKDMENSVLGGYSTR